MSVCFIIPGLLSQGVFFFFFFHANARPHTTCGIWNLLDSWHSKNLLQTSNSPDLGPSDFQLLSKLKKGYVNHICTLIETSRWAINNCLGHIFQLPCLHSLNCQYNASINRSITWKLKVDMHLYEGYASFIVYIQFFKREKNWEPYFLIGLCRYITSPLCKILKVYKNSV